MNDFASMDAMDIAFRASNTGKRNEEKGP